MSKKKRHNNRQGNRPQPQSKSAEVRTSDSAGGSSRRRAPLPPALKADKSTRRQQIGQRSLAGRVFRDFSGFGLGRSFAIGRLVVLEAMRMRIWGVILIGLAAIVIGDLTTRHFDPINDILPNLVRTSEITLTVLGIVVALFLSTYTLPHEMATRTIYSLVTKPVSRLEVVTGKFMGLVMVLALVTIGLGLPAWAYMQLRTAQVQQMARQRLDAAADTTQPTDLEPVTWRGITTRGPLAARVFFDPWERLQIVSQFEPGSQLLLNGTPNHIAHWGFEGLPVRELALGQGEITLQVEFDDPAEAEPLEHREVLVRIRDDQSGMAWTASKVLSSDGRLSIQIPAAERQTEESSRPQFAYTGKRLWFSLAGVNTPPLKVDDGSAAIRIGDKVFQSGSGLRTTTSQTMGKFWLRALDSNDNGKSLQARTRFRDIPQSLISSGAQLQIEVTVPSAVDIAPESRAVVTLQNPSQSQVRQTFTFRPERRTSLLADVPGEMLRDGELNVFLSVNDPNIEIGVNNMSVRLVRQWQPFGLNWLKDVIMSWLSFCVVAGMGLVFSTISGWYVASLATSVMVVVAHVWQTVLENVQRYGLQLGGGGHHHGDEAPAATPMLLEMLESIHTFTFRALGAVLPDVSRMSYGDYVARGISAPVGWLFSPSYGTFWQAIIYSAAMIMLAYLLFVRKEVARQ